MKKLLNLNIILTTIITGYLYWLVFIFNGSFKQAYAHNTTDRISNYIGAGGHIHLYIIGVLLFVLVTSLVSLTY